MADHNSYDWKQEQANEWLQRRMITSPELFHSQYESNYHQVTTPASSYIGSSGSSATMTPSYGGQSNLRRRACRASHVDKETGNYVRTNVRENYSTGNVFKERGTGRTGLKDEQMTTTSVRIGDRSGYSEYQVEERFRRVDFDDRLRN